MYDCVRSPQEVSCITASTVGGGEGGRGERRARAGAGEEGMRKKSEMELEDEELEESHETLASSPTATEQKSRTNTLTPQYQDNQFYIEAP